METRSIFTTLSDGRFYGDGIDDASPLTPIERVKRVVKTALQRAQDVREYKRRYRIEHRDKYLEQKRSDSRNRRALKRRADGTISAREWAEILDKYGNKCLCCSRSDVDMTQDHVLPLVLGGTNTVDNVQPLCALCNSVKGTKYVDYR